MLKDAFHCEFNGTWKVQNNVLETSLKVSINCSTLVTIINLGVGLSRCPHGLLLFLLVQMALSGLSLKKDRFVSLLEKLIGETEFLQDNPPKFVPEENRFVDDTGLHV